MIEINLKEQRALVKALIITTIGIVMLNIINVLIGEPSWQITRFINVGLESNFPTWFSGCMLIIAAFFAYKCVALIRINQNEKRMWQLFSLGLLGMSCDDVAMIHENLGGLLNRYFFKLESISHSSWSVILGLPIFIVLTIFFIKMKKYLIKPKKAFKLLFSGIFLYIGGAFLLESSINLLNHENLEWLWKIENILEESFEMFGVILVIVGIINYYKFLSNRKESLWAGA